MGYQDEVGLGGNSDMVGVRLRVRVRAGVMDHHDDAIYARLLTAS